MQRTNQYIFKTYSKYRKKGTFITTVLTTSKLKFKKGATDLISN